MKKSCTRKALKQKWRKTKKSAKNGFGIREKKFIHGKKIEFQRVNSGFPVLGGQPPSTGHSIMPLTSSL